MWAELIQFVEGQDRTKRPRNDELAVSSDNEVSTLSCPQTLVLLVLGPAYSHKIIPLAPLVLQFADSRLWDFLASITP